MVVTAAGFCLYPVFASAGLGGGASGVEEPDDIENVIKDYSDFLAQLNVLGEQLTPEDAHLWAGRLWNSYNQSTHASFRQAALVSIMSMHNQFENWTDAEEVCLLAADIAYSEEVLFERLGDLFAIQSAAAGVNRVGVDGIEERWDTFAKLDQLFDQIGAKRGIAVLSTDAIGLYRWALEERIKHELSEQNLRGVTRFISKFESFAANTKRLNLSNIPPHAVRHYRAQAARAMIASDHSQALEAAMLLSGSESYPFDMISLQLVLADQSPDRLPVLIALMADLHVDQHTDIDRLQPSYLVARCALDKLIADNEGTVVQGATDIDDPDILLAFMGLEDVVSRLLMKQPSIYRPVQVTPTRLSLSQSALLKQASELLVDFLLLDGQENAAQKYIDLAHDKFSKFKH